MSLIVFVRNTMPHMIEIAFSILNIKYIHVTPPIVWAIFFLQKLESLGASLAVVLGILIIIMNIEALVAAAVVSDEVPVFYSW